MGEETGALRGWQCHQDPITGEGCCWGSFPVPQPVVFAIMLHLQCCRVWASSRSGLNSNALLLWQQDSTCYVNCPLYKESKKTNKNSLVSSRSFLSPISDPQSSRSLSTPALHLLIFHLYWPPTLEEEGELLKLLNNNLNRILNNMIKTVGKWNPR